MRVYLTTRGEANPDLESAGVTQGMVLGRLCTSESPMAPSEDISGISLRELIPKCPTLTCPTFPNPTLNDLNASQNQSSGEAYHHPVRCPPHFTVLSQNCD